MYSRCRFFCALFLLTFPGWPALLHAQEKAAAAANTQAAATLVDAPQPQAQGRGATAGAAGTDGNDSVQTGNINGTVTDANGDLVPGATVVLQGTDPGDHRTTTTSDNAFFSFSGVKPGVTYHVLISADGFIPWTSDSITLTPGQFFDMTGIQLRLRGGDTSVTVYSSNEELAAEQVHVEEQQRVLGFIPNFYVVYDSDHVVPMTTKLKFRLAFKTLLDPINFAGAAFLAGVNQAADTPDYVQGAKGYGQRMGAVYTDGFTDLIFGGAVLPALLHQDPRYYYKGTGSTKSRMIHALSAPFICRGDNGKSQINYSTIGGDLISSGLSQLYYPESNRGAGLFIENFAVDTAAREASTLVQEFVLRKLTPNAKKHGVVN